MTRFGDHNSHNRHLLEETRRIGAPGYEAYQRTIKRMPSPLEKLIDHKLQEFDNQDFFQGNMIHGMTGFAEGSGTIGDVKSFFIQTLKDAYHAGATAALEAGTLELVPSPENFPTEMWEYWRGYNDAKFQIDHKKAAFLSPSDKHE